MRPQSVLSRSALIATCLLLSSLVSTPSRAQQDWPAKPVTLIVPSSPGGGTDAFGRFLAQALTEQMRQTFVVENKPGASGAIGAAAAAQSNPDGYTFLVASNSSLGINPGLYKSLQYDVSRDFAAVTRGVIAPMVVVAHPDTKIRNLAELVERGKREPGKLFFGTAGNGSPLYIGVRMIEESSGARFSHVPYKGAGPAYQDLLAGRLQFMLTDLATIRGHIEAGKVVPLAVTDRSRWLPAVPTFAEAGFGHIKAFTSFSVMAPIKVPAAVVRRMADEVGKAMRHPVNASKLEQLSLLPVFDTPEQFGASLKEEQSFWAGFIRQHGVQPD